MRSGHTGKRTQRAPQHRERRVCNYAQEAAAVNVTPQYYSRYRVSGVVYNTDYGCLALSDSENPGFSRCAVRQARVYPGTVPRLLRTADHKL